MKRLKNGDLNVEIVDPGARVLFERRVRLHGLLTSAIVAAGARGDVRVRLVGDDEMAAAHARYGGVQGTTDVLTFDMRDTHDHPHPATADLDVDIWACVDEASRQAGSRGIELERELLLYCIHGVLHCLGHDDHADDDYIKMHAEEDRILTAIGIGPTFALHPGGAENGGRS